MKPDLRPQVTGPVFVTGGMGGVGRALCDLLKTLRVPTIGFDLRGGSAANPLCTAIECDVREQTMFEAELGRRKIGHGAIALCAALGPLATDPLAIFETNYVAAVRNALAFIRKGRSDVSVIFFSSTAAHRRNWGRRYEPLVRVPFESSRGRLAVSEKKLVSKLSPNEAYALSKWALERAVKRLAAEQARHRVRVNCLVLGPTKTPMSKPLWKRDKTRWRELVGESPFNSANEPRDLASIVAFLVSTSARMITGAFIHVDGGWHVVQTE